MPHASQMRLTNRLRERWTALDKRRRAAAVLIWIYAAGFGLPAIPVAIYLRRNGRLPTFLDLFQVYGGPWSASYTVDTIVVLLSAFFALCLALAWAALLVWKGSGVGAVLVLLLLAVHAVSWLGFALPIPWLFGAAAVLLLASAWKTLRWPASQAETR